jgi:hypothetical protein
MTDPSVQRVRE